MTTYSSKYNIGFIRNSPIQWQNSRNGGKGFVEFSGWDSGTRANTLNAQAKLKGQPGVGGYTIINENNQKEVVNPNLGGGFADLPALGRINTPPRTGSGGVENTGAFRGDPKYPRDSDAYKYGYYYDNVKKGMKEYINDPASGYSEADKQRVLGDLQNNKLNSKDAKSLEAYNAGIMKAEHNPAEYREFLANRDKVRSGVAAALGEKVLDDAPPPTVPPTNKPPDVFKPKPPEAQTPKDPINDKVKDKEQEAWRKKNLERMMRMVGSENVLNRLNQ